MSWKCLDISENRGFEDALALNRNVIELAGDNYHMRHDLGLVAEGRERNSIDVLVNQNCSTLNGFAVLFRQQRPIAFRLGEAPLLQIPLIRHELWAGPLIVGDNPDVRAYASVVREFMESFVSMIAPGEALSIEGVPTDGELYRFVLSDREFRRSFIVLPLGAPFAHQFINMPDSMDEYLKQMGKRSRKSLQYSHRKLRKDFDDVRLMCCEADTSIDEFLDHAIEISKKTYQWRLLGLGLRDREGIARSFSIMAKRGWLRSYLLFCRDIPVAFMIGYQCHGCYYYIDVGYDPDWAALSVGSVLQYDVLLDLYERDDTPATFDFSTGDGEHKARFGNHSQMEINILLLPNTVGNRILKGAYLMAGSVSGAATQIAEKIGVKKILKRLMRRTAR
jgi:hypothetical protein